MSVKLYSALYKAIVKKTAVYVNDKRRREYANQRLAKLHKIKLTRTEKKLVGKTWNEWNSDSFGFYKCFCGTFNVNFVPNDYYDFAEHVFNPRWSSFFLQHKCNLKYIIPELNRPKTILQKIEGHYVFKDNIEISEQKAIDVLIGQDEFVCKVAFGTGGGHGVQKIGLHNVEDKNVFLKQLLNRSNDLIIQELIVQSDFMSAFNMDSVNTIRLLSLNINQRCTVLSSFIRMGSPGSFVDNLCTGGGVLVGVDSNGILSAWGITKSYDKVTMAPTGVKFEGLIVPNWEKIKDTIISFHQKIPYANLIGWDIAISADGTPIVIEINLDSAEIEAHQVFNGPVFGERLQEVKDYINKRSPKLRHAMISY